MFDTVVCVLFQEGPFLQNIRLGFLSTIFLRGARFLCDCCYPPTLANGPKDNRLMTQVLTLQEFCRLLLKLTTHAGILQDIRLTSSYS